MGSASRQVSADKRAVGPAVCAALAGLALEAVYLAAAAGPFSLLAHGIQLTDLGNLTGFQPGAAALVTLGLIGLFVLYGVACSHVRHAGPAGVPLALIGTTLFSTTLIFLYPVTAMDVYNYAVQAHVLALRHLNPLVAPPIQVSADEFVAYAGSWANSTSPYGPSWLTLSVPIALIAGPNVVVAVLLLKTLAAGAVVGTTLLLARLIPASGSPAALRLMLFGWNPLVQLELVGNGHNDSLMILLLVASIAFVAARRPVVGSVALTASALVKYLTVAAAPFFLLVLALDRSKPKQRRAVTVAASACTFVVTGGLLYLPYWVGPATLDRVRSVDVNYLASIPALVILIQPPAIWWLIWPRLGIAAAVATWQANSLRLGQATLVRALAEVYFVTVLLATHFAGWYIPLLLALAVLDRDRWLWARAVVFTFAATLTIPIWAYVWPWSQPDMSLETLHLILIPLTFLPPLAVSLAAMIWRRVSVTEARFATGRPAPGERPAPTIPYF